MEIGPREADWLVEAARARSPDDFGALAEALARRRAAGEPLQYVLGRAAFRHLDLEVGPGVMIPRPETEMLVERALEVLPQGGTAIDVGTGSGAIALSIKHERPDATVVATDDSIPALRYARLNRQRLGIDVTLLHGEMFRPLSRDLRGRVDVAVSNPPYVAESDRSSLPSDVEGHEPHHALFAGADGLAVLTRLVVEARPWLRAGGWLVCEIGEGQSHVVAGLLVRHGYEGVGVRPDLAGRDRIVVGQWTQLPS